jgi:hypothetical protein
MTCNFKNSAGTDLDSLFWIENANPGGIGFKMSNGTDLGNRYSSKVKLNQTIGYKNSAGTDIGYLRGKATSSYCNSACSYGGSVNSNGQGCSCSSGYTGTCTIKKTGRSSYSCNAGNVNGVPTHINTDESVDLWVWKRPVNHIIFGSHIVSTTGCGDNYCYYSGTDLYNWVKSNVGKTVTIGWN